MAAILNNGISFIVWFQSLGGWLVSPMNFFSFLGSETSILILIPLIYWCVDAGIGLRIATIVLVSGGVNEMLKLIFHGPRPYWFSTQVKAYAAETSFGVPSAHAQSAVSFWGMAAAQVKRRWLWLLAISFILMIGLSRLFLAVHFPHDVLAGWIIGALILWGFLQWWQAVASWSARKSLGQQVGLAFSLSLLMMVFGSIAYGSLRSWVMPDIWLANALQAGAGSQPAPVSLNNTTSFAGALFGMLAGVAWTNSQGGYSAAGSLGQKLSRLLPGLIGILVFYLGLGMIIPHGETLIPLLLRYLRYALVGSWITAGAPWTFQKLNLVQKKNI